MSRASTFRRDMARFELRKARRLAAEGRPDRAAVALLRAKLWRVPDQRERGCA